MTCPLYQCPCLSPDKFPCPVHTQNASIRAAKKVTVDLARIRFSITRIFYLLPLTSGTNITGNVSACPDLSALRLLR